MPRYSKWIGYEFACDLKSEDAYYYSGYLVDIVKDKVKNKYSYIVDVRKNGEPNNAERKIYTYKEFRQHFASKTALPN